MRALLARACLLLGLTLAAAAHATPTLSVQSLVCNGCTHTVTWSDAPAPSSTDWIGLYTPGAAHPSWTYWQYTTGGASGSIPYAFRRASPSATTSCGFSRAARTTSSPRAVLLSLPR